MFLQELWRYHKTGFALLVLFLGLMAFLNYKHGAVATPIYEYVFQLATMNNCFIGEEAGFKESVCQIYFCSYTSKL